MQTIKTLIYILIFSVAFCSAIDTHAAQVIYDKNVINSPGAESEFKKGLHYFKTEDYTNAEVVFSKLIAVTPPHQRITSAHLMYGKTLFENGKYRQAIIHLRKFNQQL